MYIPIINIRKQYKKKYGLRKRMQYFKKFWHNSFDYKKEIVEQSNAVSLQNFDAGYKIKLGNPILGIK